jgi:hypothetical protein
MNGLHSEHQLSRTLPHSAHSAPEDRALNPLATSTDGSFKTASTNADEETKESKLSEKDSPNGDSNIQFVEV